MTGDNAAARIMLVDDDPLVRSGLRLLLGGQADLTIVAEAASGQEAVDLHTADPVDLLLMDLRIDRKSTRLNSSHSRASRMPSSA